MHARSGYALAVVTFLVGAAHAQVADEVAMDRATLVARVCGEVERLRGEAGAAGPSDSFVASVLIRGWALTDPQHALELLKDLAPDERARIRAHVLGCAIAADPASAEQRLAGVPEMYVQQVLSSASRALAKRSPDEAIDFARSLRAPSQRSVATGAIAAALAPTCPEEVVALAAAEAPSALVDGIVLILAKSAPIVALPPPSTLAAQCSSPVTRCRLWATLASRLAQTSPDQARAAVESALAETAGIAQAHQRPPIELAAAVAAASPERAGDVAALIAAQCSTWVEAEDVAKALAALARVAPDAVRPEVVRLRERLATNGGLQWPPAVGPVLGLAVGLGLPVEGETEWLSAPFDVSGLLETAAAVDPDAAVRYARKERLLEGPFASLGIEQVGRTGLSAAWKLLQAVPRAEGGMLGGSGRMQLAVRLLLADAEQDPELALRLLQEATIAFGDGDQVDLGDLLYRIAAPRVNAGSPLIPSEGLDLPVQTEGLPLGHRLSRATALAGMARAMWAVYPVQARGVMDEALRLQGDSMDGAVLVQLSYCDPGWAWQALEATPDTRQGGGSQPNRRFQLALSLLCEILNREQ